jgi:hypothetical protein
MPDTVCHRHATLCQAYRSRVGRRYADGQVDRVCRIVAVYTIAISTGGVTVVVEQLGRALDSGSGA